MGTPRHSVQGKVVAVTGAGSGIGRALAVELGRRGARVSGCDVDAAGLTATAAEVPGMHTVVVDMSDRDAVEAYAAGVVDHFGTAHQIYNNAGIAFSATVVESTWDDFRRVLAVNLDGVIHGTQAFLPHLLDSGDGHVVNISSLNGYFAQPGMAHYVTAKFGVRGFSETLRTEMLLAGSPVRVSVVHPGGVATSISDNALALARAAGKEITEAAVARTRTYREKLLSMDPAQAARIIVDGVERDRPRIRVGRDAVAIDLLCRAAPTLAPKVAVAFEKRLLASEQRTRH